jgi:hypothetical protein
MAVMTLLIALLTAVNVYAVFSDDHSHHGLDRHEFGHRGGR